MGQKCAKCGAFVSSYPCRDCGYRGSSQTASTSSSCEICGKRGREINYGDSKYRKDSHVFCFDCHNEREKKRYNFASDRFSHFSYTYRTYLAAVAEFYLKPLFYNDSPDYVSLSCAYDKVLREHELNGSCVGRIC